MEIIVNSLSPDAERFYLHISVSNGGKGIMRHFDPVIGGLVQGLGNDDNAVFGYEGAIGIDLLHAGGVRGVVLAMGYPSRRIASRIDCFAIAQRAGQQHMEWNIAL